VEVYDCDPPLWILKAKKSGKNKKSEIKFVLENPFSLRGHASYNCI
tara:strand:- start:1380 stop:1517 length:138 start_codon:yes stop_codon:yes gene_type:complete